MILFEVSNFDTPAILGIVGGIISAVLAAWALVRSSRHASEATALAAKVSEQGAILNSWKEFAQAQATQSDTRAKERIAQSESQDRRIELLETKYEAAIEKFNECERKHAKLEGKFEGLGIVQARQTSRLSAQGEAQTIQGTRQDVQETRQNEQEERQNLIEHKTTETIEAVAKTKQPDC